jgi:hypothetical protein
MQSQKQKGCNGTLLTEPAESHTILVRAMLVLLDIYQTSARSSKLSLSKSVYSRQFVYISRLDIRTANQDPSYIRGLHTNTFNYAKNRNHVLWILSLRMEQ